jgi:pimeloyl-ACP methyl ester carboxylesterase
MLYRRAYWLLPDLASARATMNDLLLAGLELRRMHFVAREDCDMTGLHPASVLETSDVIHSAETGLLVGAALGGMLGAAAAMGYPDAGEGPQWAFFPALVLVGAVFDAWTSSMIGISLPSRRLRRFAPRIDEGQVLLMIDVPVTGSEAIEERLRSLHPEARLEGTEPNVLAFR